MKSVLHAVVLGLCATALAVHAQSARKPVAPQGVDLDAAARATAALYSSMPPTPVPAVAAPARAATPAPSTAAAGSASAAMPLRVVPRPALSARPSPLLPPATAPAAALAPAPQTAAPAEVWAGAYLCEHAEKVSLRPGVSPDQVELQWRAQRWPMQRMDSRSGAMRLEDASARMVWIQLPNKSMLLDQRLGRRVLDECQHEVQVQTAAQMKNNPPPALFDTNGMGR